VRSNPPARACAVSAAVPAMRRCAARRSDCPSCGRRATPAGTRRCGGGGGTPFPASRAPRHGKVAGRAPVRARGYGDGRRARCRCVAERATAPKARVLHVRAWNYSLLFGLVWGPRDCLVLDLQRQRNGTEVQTGPFGGAPKRSAKTWFRTWPSNANMMADAWRSHSPDILCDRNRFMVGPRRMLGPPQKRPTVWVRL